MFSTNTANVPRATTEKERQDNIKRASDLTSGFNNPCLKEQNLVNKCLSDNAYDRQKCTAFFANYKVCKDFWGKVKKDRRAKGIVPPLPWPDEQERVKQEYMKLWNINIKSEKKAGL